VLTRAASNIRLWLRIRHAQFGAPVHSAENAPAMRRASSLFRCGGCPGEDRDSTTLMTDVFSGRRLRISTSL
jgi:hypothetical protein